MTEPASTVGLASATLPALAEESRGAAYWTVVGRAFRRGINNCIASTWIILIILLAIFVPFLASGAPYTATIDGHREFPLFRNLLRVDWIILFCGLAAAIYLFAHWRIGKRPGTHEELRAARVTWLLSLLLAAALLSAGIWMLKHDYLDVRDYHALARAGKLHDAVFAPLRWGFADQEPLEVDRTFEFPSADHLLGTDGNGRDALARLLWGARIVLGIGLISEVIALVIGVLYGALMGYFVGKVDILGMRFVEIVEAIPTLFLLITFVALYGRNIYMLMVIIGLTSWTGIARFVRAEFLRIRALDYVTAARAAGLPLSSILFRHMLPNGLTPVIVTFTFGVAAAVTSESILSFLGIGVEPPTPSWGSMLNEAGNPAETFRWWLAIAPGFLIFLTVFAYNIIGEGLRDAIDPRLNKVQ